MIRIERRKTEKAQRAIASLQEAKRRNSTYNTVEVNEALWVVPIIDCTKEDVDKLIAFRKKGYFGMEEELVFELLDFRAETVNTQRLLQNVYYGSTPQKRMESKILRKKLRKELSEFKEYVREYQEAEGEEKVDLECLLKKQLGDSSAFAAFKRWLIRDHRENYPELFSYI